MMILHYIHQGICHSSTAFRPAAPSSNPIRKFHFREFHNCFRPQQVRISNSNVSYQPRLSYNAAFTRQYSPRKTSWKTKSSVRSSSRADVPAADEWPSKWPEWSSFLKQCVNSGSFQAYGGLIPDEDSVYGLIPILGDEASHKRGVLEFGRQFEHLFSSLPAEALTQVACLPVVEGGARPGTGRKHIAGVKRLRTKLDVREEDVIAPGCQAVKGGPVGGTDARLVDVVRVMLVWATHPRGTPLPVPEQLARPPMDILLNHLAQAWQTSPKLKHRAPATPAQEAAAQRRRDRAQHFIQIEKGHHTTWESRREYAEENFRDGDWICDRVGCGQLNYSRNQECFRCHRAPRAEGEAEDDEEYLTLDQEHEANMRPPQVRVKKARWSEEQKQEAWLRRRRAESQNKPQRPASRWEAGGGAGGPGSRYQDGGGVGGGRGRGGGGRGGRLATSVRAPGPGGSTSHPDKRHNQAGGSRWKSPAVGGQDNTTRRQRFPGHKSGEGRWGRGAGDASPSSPRVPTNVRREDRESNIDQGLKEVWRRSRRSSPDGAASGREW